MVGKPRVLALILCASFCLSGLVSQQPARAQSAATTDVRGQERARRPINSKRRAGCAGDIGR